MATFHPFTDSKGTISVKLGANGTTKSRSIAGINYLPQVADDETIYSATVSQVDSAINAVLSAFYTNVLDKIYDLAGGGYVVTGISFKTEAGGTL